MFLIVKTNDSPFTRTATSITVLILNYNQTKYLTDAFQSLMNQTLLPDQIILVDDGSSEHEHKDFIDFTKKVSSFNNQMIVIDDRMNIGQTSRMNQALGAASCEFFLLLSADDWLEPDSLEVMSEAMTIGTDIVWGNLHVVNEDGSSKGYVRPRDTWQGKMANKYLDGGTVYDDILKVNNFVSGGMTLMRVSALRKHGGWDENCTTEDLDLWLRIGKESKFTYLNSTIGNYRVIANSKSRQDEQKLLDHSYIFSKHTTGNWTEDKGLAYLAAMRWAFAVFRLRKLPKTSLSDMAKIMGISKWLLYLELPKAILYPIGKSVATYLRRAIIR